MNAEWTRRSVLEGLVTGLITGVGAAALTPLLPTRALADVVKLDGHTMGTRYRLTIASATNGANMPRLKHDIEALLESAEADFSPFRADSTLSRFNAADNTDWQKTSSDFARVLSRALAFQTWSDGAFNPAVGAVSDYWGFWTKPRGDFNPADPVDVSSREVAKRLSRGTLKVDGLRVRKNFGDIAVDLCAIAKGDALDRLCARIDVAGLENYLIEIGGELRARGAGLTGQGWRVAVERPDGKPEPWAVVKLDGKAIATSGDYVKSFTYKSRRFGHLMDPKTARPTHNDLALVSVVADTALEADALATALYVMGPDKGAKAAEDFNIPALFVRHNGDSYAQWASRDFETIVLTDGEGVS